MGFRYYFHVKIEILILVVIIIACAVLSVAFHKLTAFAAFSGCMLAMLIFAGGGYAGIIIMATFFVSGVIATDWKATQKQKNGLADNKTGSRNSGQVLANAGAPAIAGILHLFNIIPQSLSLLIIAACFSSAIADTLSSELGNVYGRKYYNILTLKKDQQGLNGVVSIEGFLFGLAGSILIAAIYSYFSGLNNHILTVIIAGTAGNILDSILGATVERKGYIKNDAVNFLNTGFAGALALLIYLCSATTISPT